MRSIWNGSLGFGLVNIPVKLYSATEQQRLNLDLLDKKDHSKIRYRRVNENTGEEVQWSDVVKGFRLNDDYVILEDKDFEKANAKKTKTIEINSFVDEKEIDSIYFDKPYYLEPEKGGRKAFALLREAMNKTGKAGIATFVLREKENLAVVRTMKEAILLNRLRFAHEVREIDELDLPPKTDIDNKQLDMAVQLIKQFASDFDISEYQDHYTDELMEIIRQKARGEKPKARKMRVAPAKSKDLMAQLKESIEKRKAS